MERWINGYEGLFSINSSGEIFSHKFNRKKRMKSRLQKTGYLAIQLRKNGRGRMYSVHRLVADAFLDNTQNKPQVNHIDGVKTNNNIKNLEWTTRSENLKHAYRIGIKNNDACAMKTSKKVLLINLISGYITEFKSQKEASKKLNIGQGHISECCMNKRKRISNYKFLLKGQK